MAVASLRLWPPPPPSSSCSLLGTSKPPPKPPFRSSCCCCSPQLSLSSIDITLREIKNSGIIACLRAQSSELAIEAARAAISGGISVLEIVMSTPGVFEVLQQLVQDHPTTVIGVGTVLNTEDAKNAINAGAKFLMSPAMVKGIADDIQGGDILYIPGAMTPTEISGCIMNFELFYPQVGLRELFSSFYRYYQHIMLVRKLSRMCVPPCCLTQSPHIEDIQWVRAVRALCLSCFCIRWHPVYISTQQAIFSYPNGCFSRHNNRSNRGVCCSWSSGSCCVRCYF